MARFLILTPRLYILPRKSNFSKVSCKFQNLCLNLVPHKSIASQTSKYRQACDMLVAPSVKPRDKLREQRSCSAKNRNTRQARDSKIDVSPVFLFVCLFVFFFALSAQVQSSLFCVPSRKLNLFFIGIFVTDQSQKLNICK